MDSTPQIQSVISSKNVTSKSAMQTLKKFLETQKAYFVQNKNDTLDIVENEEDYFNMDDNEDKLGYEEFEQRINAMIDSLTDDYFTRKPTDKGKFNETSTLNEANNKSSDSDNIEPTATKQEEKELEKSKKEKKKEMKELKKALKKQEKEAKRLQEKEAKEARKAEKAKQKLIKKEMKTKRKREKDEERSSKRARI